MSFQSINFTSKILICTKSWNTRQYASEERVATLSRYFAGIAIIISCLGLFGLAAFTTERRIKEIGIRKILGSSDFQIVRLLSIDFTRMVLVAIVLAIPISYLFASSWIESFAYRIDLEWWFFGAVGILALLIVWFTVGLQTMKAARINPTDCLRDE
jgi:ABC-type antimicrobial peptide transport system permease subunit